MCARRVAEAACGLKGSGSRVRVERYRQPLGGFSGCDVGLHEVDSGKVVVEMSGRKAGRMIWMGIKLFLMAGCYFLAVRYCTSAQKTSDIVTSMLAGDPLSAKSAQEICEQEETQEDPQYICFWGEVPDTTVLCRETGKSSKASLILTSGNPELVIPGIFALMWQKDGCCIDKVTAQELFGTAQAAGQTLWCGEKPYTVCGTFESPGRAVVRQCTDEDVPCLDTVSLRADRKDRDAKSGSILQQGGLREEAEQFLMRNGLTGEVIEFTSLGTFAGDLLLILPLILVAGLIRFLFQYQKSITQVGGKLFCAGLILLTVLTAGWLTLHHLKIPSDMIPSKWSDFSFWSDWWKSQRQNLLRILRSAQGEAQLMMLWNLLISLLCNLFSIFAGISVVHSMMEKEQAAGKL